MSFFPLVQSIAIKPRSSDEAGLCLLGWFSVFCENIVLPPICMSLFVCACVYTAFASVYMSPRTVGHFII